MASEKLQTSQARDAALLTAFLNDHSQEAFAGLVRRHSRMVLGVCIRVLRNGHDAEDAFQATFFTLAQTGHRIRRRESLSCWLHGVALKTSVGLWRKRQQHQTRGLVDAVDERSGPLVEIGQSHELRVLDEELGKLPLKYRQPLILFYLSGKSRLQIAQQLGVTPCVVKGRLQRGRRELRNRLLVRGASLAALSTVLLTRGSVSAAHATLIDSTVLGGVGCRASTRVGSSDTSIGRFHASQKGAFSMTQSLSFTAAACLVVMIMGSVIGQGTNHQSLAKETEIIIPVSRFDEEKPVLHVAALASAEAAAADSGRPVLVVKYGDGKPDGKKSIGGNGEMIQFELPDEKQKIRSLRIHCARYGTAQAPKEDIEISFVSEDESDVLHSEQVPYSRFKRGTPRWTTIAFDEPIELPKKFWVIMDFGAERTKGVYVSYDTSTKGEKSRIGLPGSESKPVSFGGDWMVQLILTKP